MMSDVAGREMDALVADKVMGFAHEQQLVLGDYHGVKAVLFLSPEQAAYRRKSEHDCYWERWSPSGDEVVVSDCVPPYSTDIAAAWTVIEKLGMVTIENEHPDGQWSVGFVNKRGGWIHAEADTAPCAICKAALKAIGHTGSTHA